MKSETIHFVTDLFQVEPGEEEETNPGIFGKQLAYWVKKRFEENGYSDIEIVPEDWGWCVILQRKPNLIWVGCSGQKGVEFSTEYFEESEEGEEGITWNCFLVMEAPFFKKFLGNKNSTETFVKIREFLVGQLSINQDICFVKEAW